MTKRQLRRLAITATATALLAALLIYCTHPFGTEIKAPPRAPAATFPYGDVRPPGHEYHNPIQLIADIYGPRGNWHRCDWKFYGLTPYQACELGLQPGSVLDLHNWIVRNGPAAGFAFSQAVAWVCALAGIASASFWGGVCATLAVWFAGSLIWFTNLAAQNKQCVRITFKQVLGPLGWYPIEFKIANFGQWETWIWYIGKDGLSWRTWGYPTRCLMPRPRPQCTPEGVCIQLGKA